MSGDGNSQFLIFIHGVGGARKTEEWLKPLSDVMAQLGHSRPESSGVRVLAVSYRPSLLTPSEGKLPPETWRKPREIAAVYSDYQIRRAEVESLARHHRSDPPLAHMGQVNAMTAEKVAGLVEKTLGDLRREARRYRTDPRARGSVVRRVLEQLPTSGRAVIVAHSLGSVVAADIVKRLPDDVIVDQLITVGSPLPLSTFWPFIQTRGDGFPFDKVRSWVNVFDPLDPVSSGRGIGLAFPEVLDIDVHVGAFASLVSNHAAATYLSLPVVGALVGDALFGSPDEPTAAAPARRRGRAWDLYLLGAAYATQVSATCHPKRHEWRRRFDAARSASVSKLLATADEQAEQLSGTDAHPFPTQHDLLDHAAALIRGTWSDDELLPFVVALLMSSPVRPFEIHVDEEHAQEALAALLNRVRTAPSNIADQVFAKRVAEALEEAKDAMGRSQMWAYLMLGGAAVLAATGIGVWAAMPAGVAGAALLTSTLAAFGPGGMVGGMVTIAAASGAGSALLGAGVVSSPSEASESFLHFAGSLAALPKDQLRATITGMLAALLAQESLGLTRTVEQTRSVLSTTFVHTVNEQNMHMSVGSKAAKEWAAKRSIIETALRVIDKRFPFSARIGVLKALEKDEGDLRVNTAELKVLLATAEPRALPSDHAGAGAGNPADVARGSDEGAST